MKDLYQSKNGPSVELLSDIIINLTEETRTLDAIEEMLSNLIENSAPRENEKHKFGIVWLTRSNVQENAPSGTFQVFYSPSQWEHEHRVFTSIQFVVATGNYIKKSIRYNFPDNTSPIYLFMKDIFLKMGLKEISQK